MRSYERLVFEVTKWNNEPTFYARTIGSDMPRMMGQSDESAADAVADMFESGVMS